MESGAGEERKVTPAADAGVGVAAAAAAHVTCPASMSASCVRAPATAFPATALPATAHPATALPATATRATTSRGRFCSHTRLSSVDSTRLSGSTVFSSQDEEEGDEENSAFEMVPDSSPQSREAGGEEGERWNTGWRGEGRRGESGEPSTAGCSDHNAIGETSFHLF